MVPLLVCIPPRRKAYVEQEYQARIDLREAEAELNYLSSKSANRRRSREDIRL